MSTPARDRLPDSTLAMAWRGYRFGYQRFDRYQTDVFESRVLLESSTFLRGADAARLLYDSGRFVREGAMPMRVQKSLLGVGGVQGLDGPPHQVRKRMFMSMMTPAGIESLRALVAQRWLARLAAWEGDRDGRVVLFDEVGEILCHAVCAWAGVPATEDQVHRRTRDLHAMIDAPAAVGPRYWRGTAARRRTERSLAGVVDQVRERRLVPPAGSALEVIASHHDQDGHPLDSHVAAVELLNVLRPTVAVDRFVVFAALALHEHPQWAERLRAGADQDVHLFVQEVRRCYPFFPMVGARVREAFDWRGVHFPSGRRVLLDLYGTDHDARIWERPERFEPDRFLSHDPDQYELIPQGGGDHYAGHRCPGEWITIALMTTAVEILTRGMTYVVPQQDLQVSLRRIPTLPASGFVIADIRAAT
jgi:fatty-acid peroxygenase